MVLGVLFLISAIGATATNVRELFDCSPKISAEDP